MSRLELAVYETLSTPDTPLHVMEICSGVKRKVPDLCDDSIFPCPYCKLKRLDGAFHGIKARTKIVPRKKIEELHRALKNARKIEDETGLGDP